MLFIPLPWSRVDLELLRDEHDLFDLFMKESIQPSYLIVENNTITWVGQGTVPGKTAYQIKARTIGLGEKVENPIFLGNVGFGGDFMSIEDSLNKKYSSNGYCINDMRFSSYQGQKIKGNKDHYAVIEPILCLLSDEPSVRLKHFLEKLGWGGRTKIECLGTWKNNLKLLIDGEEYSTIEGWLTKFYQIALPHQNTSRASQNTPTQESENLTFKDGMLGILGIIFIILILKSCFGG